jgi:3-oxoacyl-[acyl-carrier protein] reductase
VSTRSDLLRGRRLLIVGGAGTGVGHAISVATAAAGADIAIVDLDQAAAEATAKEVLDAGASRVIPLSGDVRNGDDIERVVAEAAAALGGLDGLVPSLGGTMAFGLPFVRVHEHTDDSWDKTFDLNIRYVFRFLRPVLKVLLEQGTGGTIVTVGSDGGTAGHGSPLNGPYSAAKCGLSHLTKSLAVEYGPDGIRVNMVSPGPTATGNVASMPAETRDAMSSLIPLGHWGAPENIADAVVFLLSDMSAHVSGQIIGVDGGLSVQRPAPSFSTIYSK